MGIFAKALIKQLKCEPHLYNLTDLIKSWDFMYEEIRYFIQFDYNELYCRKSIPILRPELCRIKKYFG